MSSESSSSPSAHDPAPLPGKSNFGDLIRNHPFLVSFGAWAICAVAYKAILFFVDELPVFPLSIGEVIYLLVLLTISLVGGAMIHQFRLRHLLRTANEIAEIQKKSEQLHSVGLLGLSRATSIRDNTMALHLRRVGALSEHIGRALSRNPKYQHYITEQYLADLKAAAALHDVGRIGIADTVLRKASGLNAEEFEMMKMHVIVGGDLISELERSLPFQSYYTLAKEVTYHHHQRWDGTGYPNVMRQPKEAGGDVFFVQDGIGAPLKGTEIPLSARIVAIADVYDAVVSRRRYRDPVSHDDAVALIEEKSGSHFDPDVVEAFLSVQKDVEWIVEEIKE